MALALVRDLRDHRAPASEEDLADFETNAMAYANAARDLLSGPVPKDES